MGRPPSPPPGFQPPFQNDPRFQHDPRQQPPQQQNWYPPPVPQRPPGPSIGTHIKRLFDWNVAEIAVTPRERQQLEQAGVVEPRLQGLLAWRRSTLLLILPVLILSLILSIFPAVDSATDPDLARVYTSFGALLQWTPVLALIPVPIGVAVVLAKWTDLTKPSRTLVVCWLISIAISLLPGVIPFEWVIDVPGFTQFGVENGADADEIDAILVTLRTTFVVSYAIHALPVMIATAGGVLKGAARIKSMFPAAILPGWFLLIIAPFYSLIVISVFAVIQQEIGNGLLTLGVILLAAAPLMYVVFHKSYTRPMTSAEATRELGRLSRIGGIIMWSGVVAIALYLFTGSVGDADVLGTSRSVDDGSALIAYSDAAQTGIEVYARSVVTSVVMCLVFLNMVYREWRTFAKLSADAKREHDAEMQVFRRFDDSSNTVIYPVLRPQAPRPPDQPPFDQRRPPSH